MGQELYVYYQLDAGQADAVLAAFEQLHAALRQQWPALQSRLLRRAADAYSQQTWMEIHVWPDAEPPPDWTAQIERMAQAMTPLLNGPRHCELFEALRCALRCASR